MEVETLTQAKIVITEKIPTEIGITMGVGIITPQIVGITMVVSRNLTKKIQVEATITVLMLMIGEKRKKRTKDQIIQENQAKEVVLHAKK